MKIAVCVLALPVLLAAAACGESGPSEEEFVAEVDAICREHQRAIEEEAEDVLDGGAPSPEEFRQLATETIIPETEAQFEMLGELEPPQDMAVDFEAYVEEGREAVEQMRQDPVTITDPANFEDVNRRARELGFSEACFIGPR